MGYSRRWSKRYDVKVVPRRYMHLYRCFGWTPTSPVAMPQYDWERKGPNSAAAYTSADISLNLQDYDDLGMQRKELIAVKRNTKFYQYKKEYPKFFKNEKTFNRLMNKYTVSNSGKRRSIKQLFSVTQRVFDFIWAIVCAALIALCVVPMLFDVVKPYLDDNTYMAIAYIVLGVFFCFMATRRLSFGKRTLVYNSVGEDENFRTGLRVRSNVVSFRNWAFLIPGLFFIFVGLYAFGIFKGILPELFTEEGLHENLTRCIIAYGACGFIVHLLAIFRYNPYAWIKSLCLQARPITKKILLSDMSMMSRQQRQRYQQGRIISAAVNDALDKRANGINEDFYIGY